MPHWYTEGEGKEERNLQHSGCLAPLGKDEKSEDARLGRCAQCGHSQLKRPCGSCRGKKHEICTLCKGLGVFLWEQAEGAAEGTEDKVKDTAT